MNLSRVRAIVGREFTELRKNRALMSTIFVPALLLTIIPLGVLGFLGSELGRAGGGLGNAGEFRRILELSPELSNLSAGEVAQFIIVQQFLVYFLLMPLIIPMAIAGYSIVGEKQQRSLEPLLATPVQTSELLLGKSISAVVPAVLVTWGAFVFFLVAARFLIQSDRVYAALVNPKWLLAMVLLAPLLSLLSVSIAVVVSSRVNDTRAVQQIGGFVVLPIVIIGVAQTSGLILLNAVTFVLGALFVAALDAAILWVGVRLFQREKILTQWK